MALIKRFSKNVQKIGKQSTGIIFPKPATIFINWLEIGTNVDIELHTNEETNEKYIIIKEVKNE